MGFITSKCTLTRRQLLIGSAAFAVTQSIRSEAQTTQRYLNANRVLAYVGTYTSAASAWGNGEGIYLFELNPLSGELSRRKLAAKAPNPSWITIHPSGKYLYSVNEVDNFHGDSGSVSAFAIDAETGGLTALNTVSSEGSAPAYLSIDASGRFAFVANYGGGSIAVLPILPGGMLGSAIDVHREKGFTGMAQPAGSPPGSFAVSGHDAPHAHMIAPDPQGRFVLSTDLGQDRIYVYRFDPGSGNLSPHPAAPFVSLPSGDGPRHFAFHPNGDWLYTIQEEVSTVCLFRFDPTTGALVSEQTISALPPGFAGTSFALEILIAPSGRFLYATNRLHDTVAVFSIDNQGRLLRIGETSTMGDYPGQCKIDPSGRFLFACNRRSDSITSFKIDQGRGLLTFTGQYVAVGSPGCIAFLS
jgi:6-phosphogluconolactonase (cycloisomerase 2 family)